MFGFIAMIDCVLLVIDAVTLVVVVVVSRHGNLKVIGGKLDKSVEVVKSRFDRFSVDDISGNWSLIAR